MRAGLTLPWRRIQRGGDGGSGNSQLWRWLFSGSADGLAGEGGWRRAWAKANG